MTTLRVFLLLVTQSPRCGVTLGDMKLSTHRLLAGVVILLALVPVASDAQLAVEYLEEYVASKEAGGADPTAAWATVIAGGTVAAAGGVLYFAVPEQRWDSTTRYTVSGTMVGTGLVAGVVGTAMLASGNVDYRSRYEHIFTQPIADLRDRQAAGALFRLADDAYRRRRLSGFVKLTIPLLAVGSTVTANALLEDREWYQDVPTIAFSQIWSVVSGLSDLARRSPEERLYARYRAERARQVRDD